MFCLETTLGFGVHLKWQLVDNKRFGKILNRSTFRKAMCESLNSGSSRFSLVRMEKKQV